MQQMSPSPIATTNGARPRGLEAEGRPGGGCAVATPPPDGEATTDAPREGARVDEGSPRSRPCTGQRVEGEARGAEDGHRDVGVRNGKRKGANKKTVGPAVETRPPQPLSTVLHALAQLQSRAPILEHLAEYVLATFHGNEGRGPKKLLALPDGTHRPAELEVVLVIAQELRQSAYEARCRMRRIKEAGVLVEREVVDHDEIPHGPRPPPPHNEGVVDVGGRLPGAVAASRSPR